MKKLLFTLLLIFVLVLTLFAQEVDTAWVMRNLLKQKPTTGNGKPIGSVCLQTKWTFNN